MPPKKKATKKSEPEVTVTDAVTGEEVTPEEPDGSEVSVSALRQGARDSNAVRHLQTALAQKHPGVTATGNYGSRTAALVAEVLGEGDGRSLTKEQARKVLGKGYKVVD